MTEEEWLACEDPERMYFFATEEAEQTRKSRMLGCACARRLWHLLDPLYQTAIEVAEKYEDDRASADDLDRVVEAVTAAMYTDYRGQTDIELARIVVEMATHRKAAFPDLDKAASAFAWDAENAENDWDDAREQEVAVQVTLVHDIFGNPFRPVTFSQEWRTFTTVAMAKQMYESRDFSAMPILADAFQDADCDSTDILDHCRGVGLHVRGCWVVDMLLEKENC